MEKRNGPKEDLKKGGRANCDMLAQGRNISGKINAKWGVAAVSTNKKFLREGHRTLELGPLFG